MTKAIFKNSELLGLELVDKTLIDVQGYQKIDLIDKEGYLYYLSNDNLRTLIKRNGKPCTFYNNNPYTLYNIQQWLNKNEINLNLISSEVINATTNLNFYCPIHNCNFHKTWNEIKNGRICPKCAKENKSQQFLDIAKLKHGKNKGGSKSKYPIDYIRQEAREKYNINVVSNEYVNNTTKLEFICPKHSKQGIQFKSWGNMQRGIHPCKYCSNEETLKRNQKTHAQYFNSIKDIIENKYELLSEYTDCKTKIKVKCLKCNGTFDIRPDHLRNGHGCSHCIKSKGEERIENYLKLNKLKSIREKRFEDCRSNQKAMPFDFYLLDLNICIEFQGEQHYEPVEYFGGEKQLKKQQFNDKLKREYCKNNNIKLIEIPYWDYDNIEKILYKELIN